MEPFRVSRKDYEGKDGIGGRSNATYNPEIQEEKLDIQQQLFRGRCRSNPVTALVLTTPIPLEVAAQELDDMFARGSADRPRHALGFGLSFQAEIMQEIPTLFPINVDPADRLAPETVWRPAPYVGAPFP